MDSIEFLGTPDSVEPFISGWLAGGQAGFNVQNGPFVIGGEIELSATNTNGTRACGTDPGTDDAGASVRFSPLLLTCETSLNWIATAAARFGVTWFSDRTLTYVKVGGAWADIDVAVGCVFGPNNDPAARHCQNPQNQFTNGFTASEGRFGALFGVGTEFGLTREWSAKGEVNVIWFGDDEIAASDGTRLNIGASIVQAKIGVNYRFGALPY